MYHYLTVATLKRGFDGWCGDSSNVLMIIVHWCLSLFNVMVIALLVVIGADCRWGTSTSLWLTLLRYNGYHLVRCNTQRVPTNSSIQQLHLWPCTSNCDT